MSRACAADSPTKPMDKLVQTNGLWSNDDNEIESLRYHDCSRKRAGTSKKCDKDGNASFSHLLLLTLPSIGLQIIWSSILANGTPYILGLGFSQRTSALIWAFSPFCGTFLQPFIGLWSDSLAGNRFGRRKPFIVCGIFVSIVSMLGLAFGKSWPPAVYSRLAGRIAPRTMTIIAESLCVIWLLVLVIGIQLVQGGIRAFVVDQCSPHQQYQASAYTSRLSTLGAIVTYLSDHLIIELFPERSFEVLCLIASCGLALTTLPALVLIPEKRIRDSAQSWRSQRTLRNILGMAAPLSSSMKTVCYAQFLAWLGWFPFSYYSTSCICELAAEAEYAYSSSTQGAGVQAYFLFALVAFYFSITLPWIYQNSGHTEVSGSYLPRMLPTPSVLWAGSQCLFALLLPCTLFVTTPAAGTTIIATCGFSWATNLWIPLAMISEEVSDLGEEQTGILMSIYNAAISLPQILAAGLCGLIFWLYERQGASNRREAQSFAWVLTAGGIASFGAAVVIMNISFRKTA